MASSIAVPFSRTPVDDPAALGIDPVSLDALVVRAYREIDQGVLPSCQIAVAREGRIAAWVTVGAAAPTSRYVIFSCTKALVAGAVWILIGEGLLDPGERVSTLIPEFGSNGKDVITIDQVLLHTGGFPRAPLGPPDWYDREARVARMAGWRCNWEPGTRYEYHATSAHWVLAELIERVCGTDYRTFVRERITQPLGITGLQLGVPEAEQADVNDLVLYGERPSPDEIEAVLGIRELPVTEVTPEAMLRFNTPPVRALGVPGGGAVSTAADLALYYQALLHNPGGMWKPDVLADVTGVVRNTMRDYLGTPANRSRGLVIAGGDGRSHMRGFGHTVSARAFGHDGAAGQIAFADPETGLSFCYLTNGSDQHVLREGRRVTGIASRAAVCAGEAQKE